MRVAPVIALLALLALVACGDDEAGQASTPPPGTRSAPESTTVAERTAGADPTASGAQARARRGLRLRRVGSFDEPTHVTAPPGDPRLFVVERGGTVRVLENGQPLPAPFLDIRDRTTADGERGLFSIAFPPDHADSGLVYVSHTDRAGDSRVAEYRVAAGDPNRLDPDSRREVLFERQPASNHNGGLIAFGPDRMLYVGLGDGGGGNDQHGARGNAQNLGTRLGKLLRIDPRASGGRPYTVPSDNPFLRRSGAEPEVHSYGLRNPWRFSFDRANGALTIGDVGQDAVEEVNYRPFRRAAGANYGWRPWEGNRRVYPNESAPGHVRPAVTHRRAEGFCSITGGVVVRDRRLADLYGRYVYGDLCAPNLRTVRLSSRGARDKRRLGARVSQLVSFGEDARGRVYAVSLDGPVYRLDPRS